MSTQSTTRTTRWISGVDTHNLPFTQWEWPTPVAAHSGLKTGVDPLLVRLILGFLISLVMFVLAFRSENASFAQGLTLSVALLFLGYCAITGLRLIVRSLRSEIKNRGTKLRGNVHGVAGSVEGQTQFAGAAKIGAEGEKRTAQLLQIMAETIPGVHVFHGLRFPGSKRADVDHAIVYGKRVWLIDSKLFAAGHYTLYQDSIVGPKREMPTHMSAAVDGFRKMMPAGTMVTSTLVVHGREATVEDASPLTQCTIVRPEQMMTIIPEQIRAMSAKDARHADPAVLKALQESLITD